MSFSVKRPMYGGMMKINDEVVVTEQYEDSTKLEIRTAINTLYRQNKYGWYRWVFDQYRFFPGAKVLELGCGTGAQWAENRNRIPSDCAITLSDFSHAMLQKAHGNLRQIQGLHFMEVDACCIPFPTYTFDRMIANHMLYHLKDPERALREVSRTLKPDGVFYATTTGSGNMRELKVLTDTFDTQFGYPDPMSIPFRLENGQEILGRYFADVQVREYKDALCITDAGILCKYILSMGSLTNAEKVLAGDRRDMFIEYLNEIIRREGCIRLTKQTGMFVCGNR